MASEWQVRPDGVRIRVHTDGEKLMLLQVEYSAAGSTVATHSHPHEQMSYVLSGRVVFTMDGKQVELGPGEAVNVLGNVLHSAVALEPSLVLEAFTPPRAEFR